MVPGWDGDWTRSTSLATRTENVLDQRQPRRRNKHPREASSSLGAKRDSTAMAGEGGVLVVNVKYPDGSQTYGRQHNSIPHLGPFCHMWEKVAKQGGFTGHFFFLIVVRYTKCLPSPPFVSSELLSTFPLLCHHHYCASLEGFTSSQTQTPYPWNTNSHFPSPSPQRPPSPFRLCKVHHASTACKWNQRVFVFLWLASFT